MTPLLAIGIGAGLLIGAALVLLATHATCSFIDGCLPEYDE